MDSHHSSRRGFIKRGLAAAAAAFAPGLAGVSRLAEAASQGTPATFETIPSSSAYRATEQRVQPTRIDAHGHTVTGLTPDGVISLMDQAGISHMVLMPRGQNDALTTEIYKRYPLRILPFLGTMYPAWHRQDNRMLAFTEKRLATGLYKGIGEVMLRYYGIPSRNEPEINIPADSIFMKRLADIVEHHDAVMTIHMEPEPEAIEALENLLNYNKKLKLIWAHCGTVARVGLETIGHADIGAVMDRHPNLYTDIAGVQPASIAPAGGLRRPSITNAQGELRPRFKSILEKHSDRVLFGLDTPWKECWSKEPFTQWVKWADNVVAQLADARMAERIMHENAARLFNI